MGIMMNQESVDHSSFLQINELKEKVKSLVSEVDLHPDNAKFNIFDLSLNSSVCSDTVEDEIIDFSDTEFDDETNWLTNENENGESVQDISEKVYFDIDDSRPDIAGLVREVELASKRKTNLSSYQKGSIDSRTFTRPKKHATRSPLTSVLNATEDGRPKLQRRLTTTINPTPSLISKLEELSKTNNRPISGDYGEANWEDGSEDGLAEFNNPPAKSKRQSLPVSLIARLQELKKANSSYKLPKVVEPNFLNGRLQDDYESDKNATMMEDAMKVKAALEADLTGPQSISGFSDAFRNIPDYSSDDNESLLSLSNVSGFCDRLTLSTDQNTYSAIIREMEEQEIRLFHRTLEEEKAPDNKSPFSPKTFPKSRNTDRSQVIDEKNDLNRTYEIIEGEADEKPNCTYNVKDAGKHNIMNSTYDANKKPGLVDIILQSDVIKTLSPNNGLRVANNINNNNINNNNNNNNNGSKTKTSCDETFITSDKSNGTLDQNQLNVLHSEKYSTKVFDSSYRKSDAGVQRFSSRRSNGKSSDYSEDDCMSTTSDKSSRSAESNSEFRSVEEFRDIVAQQNEKLTSTPITDQMSKFQFEVVSPIRMEVGDGESRAYSSRGENPRRISAPNHIEGVQRYGMPNLKQPLKVPQRELKLKPALIRPPQNFKRPLSSTRTSSEPSVPQKIENCQSATSVHVLRPTKPTAVPSLTNMRPSRASGIPRPPTRLKQPQIRVNYSKK